MKRVLMHTNCKVDFTNGESYTFPCAITVSDTEEGYFWLLSNEYDWNGSGSERFNWLYSWSFSTDFRLGIRNQGFPDAMYEYELDELGRPANRIRRRGYPDRMTILPGSFKNPVKEKGIILSKRLFDVLTGTAVFCKKGDKEEVITLDMDYMFGNTNVTLNLESTDRSPNCFDIRKGEVSYFMGVQPHNDNGKWEREGRQVMKASRFVAMLKPFFVGDQDLFPRAVELIAEKLKSFGVFNVCVSDKPSEIYKTPSSHTEGGTVRDSCMNAESSHIGAKHVDFYDIVGAKIAYILDSNNNLSSRALLWHNVINDANGEKFNFMDRIYGSERHIAGMIEWANENGYYRKVEQSYTNTTLINESDHKISRFHYPITQEWIDFGGIPYVDTLHNFDTDDSCLSTQCGIDLQDLDGNEQARDENMHECTHCGDNVCDDDIVWVHDDPYCSECTVWSDRYGRHLVESESMNVRGYGYVDDDDDDFVEVNDRWYHRDDTFECTECGDIFHENDCVHHDDGDYCQDCYDELFQECSECGEVTRKDDLIDGVCESCHEKMEKQEIELTKTED